MRLKEGFIVRDVAGRTVVLPSGDELDLNMMITLNETGKFLWELLERDATEDSLVAELRKEYEVDEATARKCVAAFVDELNKYGFLD